MAILGKNDILEFIKSGKLAFDPAIDGFQLQPNSVDLRLGYSFYIPKTWDINENGRVVFQIDYLDTETKPDALQLIKLSPGQYFELLPSEFVIASTLEKINMNNNDLTATLYARSTFIRRGLIIESGLVDVKYQGTLMLPIVNNTSQIIRLYPGERICQLVFSRTETPLSDEQAQKHGLADAKYLSSTPYGLQARHDKIEEVQLIKDGKIDELKTKFPIE